MRSVIQSCKRKLKSSIFGKKEYVDLTPIKVPVKHQGKVRYVNAKRGLK